MTDSAAAAVRRTPRWTRRRAQILNIASVQINTHGVRGLTLTAVAKALGLDTSSVTYYFRFKEDLAAACFQRTLDHLHDLAASALMVGEPRENLRRFIDAATQSYRNQREPGSITFANLADMAALEEEIRAPLDARYEVVFAATRALFGEGEGPHRRSRTALAAHILLANAFWMAAWIYDYRERDYPRVAERLLQTLSGGLGATPPIEPAQPLEAQDAPQDAQTRFLHAATNLINRIGYRGASVERISAELAVSVGSFYHHLSGKDELVLACFERSLGIIERAQAQVAAHNDSAGARLGRLVTLLLGFQFAAESPLLRSAAYQTLPPDMRERMLRRSYGFTLHVAGLIADGALDGSLRPLDPLIAGQGVVAAIYAAADVRAWARDRGHDDAVRLYADAIFLGLGVGYR